MSRTRKDQGVSLAKGPAALLGLAMIAWGVIHFLSGGNSFSASPPDGSVTGDTFLGLEGNGWTNALWAAGGLLLAFGAPLHWGAKAMSIIVAIVLGAAALVGASDGDSVFGIFATNGKTQLVQAAVAVALLVIALLPRVGGGRKRDHDHDRHRDEERVVEERPVRDERGERFDRDHDVVAERRPAGSHSVRDGR